MRYSSMPPVNRMIPIHPGEFIREEYMTAYELTPAQLAAKLGVSQEIVDALVTEKPEGRITEDLANRLSDAFYTTITFWINLQKSFDNRMKDST